MEKGVCTKGKGWSPLSHGDELCGWTPLHVAVINGHTEMAKLLHRHGADITHADQDGTFPVHAAACRGHLHIIQFLSQIGVNMEARGTIYVGAEWNQVLNNATPAMIARHHGYAEIVKFLQATSDVQSASMVGTSQKCFFSVSTCARLAIHLVYFVSFC